MFIVFSDGLRFLFDFFIAIRWGVSMFLYKYNMSLGRFLFSVYLYFHINFIDDALKFDLSHFPLRYVLQSEYDSVAR